MSFWDWVAISIVVPAALFLIVVCIVSAVRMDSRDAKKLQSYLIASILFMMAAVGINSYIEIYEVPVIGWLTSLGVLAASFYIVYSAIVFTTFLFRKRYRKIGFRMAVVCTLAIWWMMLTESDHTPPYDGQREVTEVTDTKLVN